MGRGTLGEALDGSREPRRGPERVGVDLGRLWTGRGTLGEVRVVSGDPR